MSILLCNSKFYFYRFFINKTYIFGKNNIMQICKSLYGNYKTNYYLRVQNKKPAFCAKNARTILKKISFTNKGKELTSITEISAGKFGTVCKGSIPLSNFFRQIDKIKIPILKYTGISTNDNGYAYCFLKSSANKPISTSFVQDCSVMYLYNQTDNTHFMYHIYKDVQYEELKFLIKQFMPNGYGNASIIPGNALYKYEHELYLNKVFDTIKTNNPDAKINVYHFSSKSPEIVGYRGMVYEIPNKTILQHIKNGANPYFIKDLSQATFKIQDIRVSPDLYNLSRCNDFESIKVMKEKIKKAKYDREIKKVFFNILDARWADIQRIENCSSMEELYSLKKELYFRDIQSYFNWGYKGYENIISKKRESLKNN